MITVEFTKEELNQVIEELQELGREVPGKDFGTIEMFLEKLEGASDELNF